MTLKWDGWVVGYFENTQAFFGLLAVAYCGYAKAIEQGRKPSSFPDGSAIYRNRRARASGFLV
jgi:hypothetical protein